MRVEDMQTLVSQEQNVLIEQHTLYNGKHVKDIICRLHIDLTGFPSHVIILVVWYIFFMVCYLFALFCVSHLFGTCLNLC